LDTNRILLMLRRRRLQMNPLFPPSMQVDCRRPSCWGLGYTGSETVMCFFCEEQWVFNEDSNRTEQSHSEYGMLTKSCPECKQAIEKNGGCDHMTCRCGHEFWWTSLRPYRH
jgi:ariadne-1